MQKPVVHLRVVRGELTYKADRQTISNENHPVKIEHDTFYWTNYMKQLPNQGFGAVEVEKVLEKVDGKWVPASAEKIEAIKAEVAKAFKPVPDVPETPDQKRIRELEATLKELLGKPSTPAKSEDEEDTELKELRAEYVKLNGGKKGSPKWSVEDLKEKIQELKDNA